jgi:hypothetical protein
LIKEDLEFPLIEIEVPPVPHAIDWFTRQNGPPPDVGEVAKWFALVNRCIIPFESIHPYNVPALLYRSMMSLDASDGLTEIPRFAYAITGVEIATNNIIARRVLSNVHQILFDFICVN